jgi:hypothetical protein
METVEGTYCYRGILDEYEELGSDVKLVDEECCGGMGCSFYFPESKESPIVE